MWLNIGADLCNKLEIINMLEEQKKGAKVGICELGPLNKPLSLEYNGGKDCEFYGIEYSEYGYETKNAFAAKGWDIVMKECDLNKDKWPFDNNKFDVIISNQVLEHMYNTDYFFEELYGIMKPGSYEIVSVPNLSSLHNM